MAKGVQRVRGKKGLSRAPVKSGDLYEMKTDIEVADVDGDGVNDLTFTHSVDRNGAAWVEAKVVWFGLPDDVTELFIEQLGNVGFVDEEVVQTNRLNVVTKHWKNLTRALAGINKLGDQLVVSIGETV
jgi:hypothetical protein